MTELTRKSAREIVALLKAGDIEVDMPIIGVSPRELLDKLEEVNIAINEARTQPANTLQDLETQLEDLLQISNPDALSFELGDVVPGGEKDLILFGYDRDQRGNRIPIPVVPDHPGSFDSLDEPTQTIG